MGKPREDNQKIVKIYIMRFGEEPIYEMTKRMGKEHPRELSKRQRKRISNRCRKVIHNMQIGRKPEFRRIKNNG